MIVSRRRRALAAAIGALTIIHESGAAFAAGFGLREGATDWMANGYAGETAKAYDASTAFTNPAGMVRLDQSELDGSLNGIFPTVNFSGTNMLDGVPVAGSTAGNDAQSGASPASLNRPTRPRPEPRSRPAHKPVPPKCRGWCNPAVGSSQRC